MTFAALLLSRLKNSALCTLTLLLLSGCSETKNLSHLNGKMLLEQKCMNCHNLDMPAKTAPDEPAPPMMAVAFHIKSNMQNAHISDAKINYVEFIKTYVMQPSLETSFCDKESLQKYGLMPSQKGNLSLDELEAIALYMYEHYDQTKFLNMLQQQSDLNALPKGEQMARKNGCVSCHSANSKKVGPSYEAIARKYNEPSQLIASITQGSQGKWNGYKATMPPFKKLTEEELQQLTQWILTH
jgi:cytochrome c